MSARRHEAIERSREAVLFVGPSRLVSVRAGDLRALVALAEASGLTAALAEALGDALAELAETRADLRRLRSIAVGQSGDLDVAAAANANLRRRIARARLALDEVAP